jgi:hypothetical protein
MIWLYIASLVFGAVFVVPMVLGGFNFDADIGDIGADSGGVGDLDMDVDATGIAGAVGDFVGSLLNFRSMVLGSTFFGLSGMIFTVLDTPVVATLITALGLGFVAAAANSGITTFVLGRQQSSHVTLSEVQGMSAEVILPIAEDRRGQVRAQIAGQTEYFTALPFKPDYSFEPGEIVVVIEIDEGLAKVASLRELGT